MRIRSKLTLVLSTALLGAAISGCSTQNPRAGSKAYASGALGNGDFLFSCDDGAACLPYSGDAKSFPKQVATGSTFDIRFVSKDQQGTYFTDDRRYEGISVDGASPYVERGPEGLTAIKPGYGTVFAHDSAGTIVDYFTVKIVKPEALVVYNAEDDDAREPSHVESIQMKVGSTLRFRVLAEVGASSNGAGGVAAGSLSSRWTSGNTPVIAVESYASGVVTLRADSAGATVLDVEAGGLTKQLPIMVNQ